MSGDIIFSVYPHFIIPLLTVNVLLITENVSSETPKRQQQITSLRNTQYDFPCEDYADIHCDLVHGFTFSCTCRRGEAEIAGV